MGYFLYGQSQKHMRKLGKCAHHFHITLKENENTYIILWVALSSGLVSVLLHFYYSLKVADLSRFKKLNHRTVGCRKSRIQNLLFKSFIPNFLKKFAPMADVFNALKIYSSCISQ